MQPSPSTTDTRAAIAYAERPPRPERSRVGCITIAAMDDDYWLCEEPTPIYETEEGVIPCVRVSRSLSSRVATELRYLTFAYHCHDQAGPSGHDHEQQHDQQAVTR